MIPRAQNDVQLVPCPLQPSLDLASFTIATSTARNSSGVLTGLANATRTGRGP
jgi:hypothetical protein